LKPEQNRGFSLIELSIALVIIGLITGAVLKGQSLIDSSRITDAIQISEDMSTAVKAFKERYRMLPGDMPGPPVANLIAACSAGGDGNGAVDGAAGAFANVPAESQCVAEVLFKAGMIKVSGTENGFPVVRSYYGLVWLKATGSSQVVSIRGSNPYLPSVRHVIEFENLTCEAAQAIDRRIDNDSFIDGKAAASVTSCTPGGANDPVPFFAIAIQ
jgi:prepilin-type N-terminal cleavage/methylation domain-containing protein